MELSSNQIKSIVGLIDKEKQDNMDNGDGVYNTYWDFVLTALGVDESEQPKYRIPGFDDLEPMLDKLTVRKDT